MQTKPITLAPVAGRQACALKVDVVGAFDFLSSEYCELYARSSATIFQSPTWLDRAHANFAQGQAGRQLTVCVRDLHSLALVAIIPLHVSQYFGFRVASFADFGVSDYCAVVAAPADEARLLSDHDLSRAILQALANVDLVVVRKIRAQDLALFGLLGEAVKSPMQFQAHATRLAPSHEVWTATTMDQSQRRSLARKRRKLRAKGKLAVEVLDSPADLHAVLGAIAGLRAANSRRPASWDILATERGARFYKDVVDQGIEARAYRLLLDDVVLSAGFGVVGDGAFHLLLTGYNPDYRNYSVGLMIIEDAIRDCFARREQVFDLTIGDQAYKRIFGTVATSMWSVWSGISFAGALVSFVLTRCPSLLRLSQRFMRAR